MPITTLPDAPNRTTGYETFVTKVYPWIRSYVLFTSESNSLATTVNSSETVAYSNKPSSLSDANDAATEANYNGDWSSLTGAANVPYVVSNEGSLWNLSVDILDITASEPGVTSDWILIGSS